MSLSVKESVKMSVEEKDQKIIDEFSALRSWEDRYLKIIQTGKGAPGLPEEERLEDLKVKGCQSQVWLKAGLEGERVIFQADSDAMIVRGLVSLLVGLYSGETPQTILDYNPRFIDALGFQQNLSPSRANGLASMLKQIKFYALGYRHLLKG